MLESQLLLVDAVIRCHYHLIEGKLLFQPEEYVSYWKRRIEELQIGDDLIKVWNLIKLDRFPEVELSLSKPPQDLVFAFSIHGKIKPVVVMTFPTKRMISGKIGRIARTMRVDYFFHRRGSSA